MLIITGSQLVVLDATTLTQRRIMEGQSPLDDAITPPPAQLGDGTWLTYADMQLNDDCRSRGGAVPADAPSVAGHVITAAKV